jgi:predicted O-linked N-acetylglucosamine transferase (SPINDLY family)
MGVPTLTIAGDRLLSRQGASLMSAAGLQEWVAENEDAFVIKAVDFCREPSRLSGLRAALRTRLPRTPLFDAARFAENLESALWQMWRQWQRSR